jgi:DNA-directed RNA polymerase subunit RPC12/RpoP
MTPAIEKMIEQAYQLIDEQPDYTIPRLEQWKKTHQVKSGKVLSACIGCGTTIAHDPGKNTLRCVACRKKVSDLFKKRKNKNFCKNSVIPCN